MGLGRGGWSASMRNAAARTVHAGLGRGWTGQRGGHDGVALGYRADGVAGLEGCMARERDGGGLDETK